MDAGLALLLVLGLAVVALGVAAARRQLPYSSDMGGRGSSPAPDDETAPAGEEEVREFVRARNERRRRRGQAPLPEDDEVRRLLATAAERDPELREEARVLVERENARRGAHGEEPFDVEREIDRRLRELAR